MKRFTFTKLTYAHILLTMSGLLLISQLAFCQHLPNIQSLSVWTPADVKIDGKLNEWNGKLQASNRTNRFFYTVSNDSDKLYLTVLVTDKLAIDKLLEGGLVFTVSHATGKKRNTDPANAAIIYPVITSKNRNSLRGNVHIYFSYSDADTIRNKKHLDSLIDVENDRAAKVLGDVQVAGLRGLSNTVLQAKNPSKIDAMLRFGKKMSCIYELAIPLKYLDLKINDDAKFSYNLKLLGAENDRIPGAPDPPVPAGKSFDHDHEFDADVTDFWGEYQLAKSKTNP